VNVPIQFVPAAAEQAFMQCLPELAGRIGFLLIDRSSAGRALQYNLILAEFPHLLLPHSFTPAQLFWSRCYWFLRFAALRQVSDGYDAGIEQQPFNILENVVDLDDCDISLAEQIASRVNTQVQAELVRHIL
jgi:hypothetical protein